MEISCAVLAQRMAVCRGWEERKKALMLVSIESNRDFSYQHCSIDSWRNSPEAVDIRNK
jgi:hypothetical protein